MKGTQSCLEMGDGMILVGDGMGKMELEPKPSSRPTLIPWALNCWEIKPLVSALLCRFPHVADGCRCSEKTRKHLGGAGEPCQLHNERTGVMTCAYPSQPSP